MRPFDLRCSLIIGSACLNCFPATKGTSSVKHPSSSIGHKGLSGSTKLYLQPTW